MSEERIYETFENVPENADKVTMSADDAYIICFDARYDQYGVEKPEVKANIYETSRWSEHWEHIIKDTKGRYWKVYYSKGSTEMQSERPFEYEDEVTFSRIYKMTVIKEEFVSVSESEEADTIRDIGLSKEKIVIDKR